MIVSPIIAVLSFPLYYVLPLSYDQTTRAPFLRTHSHFWLTHDRIQVTGGEKGLFD